GRLFNLGFTKLYVLHYLPASLLEKLLEEGIEWRVGEEKITTMIPLEAASVTQLKRALSQGMDTQVKKSPSAGPRLAATNALNAIMSVQAKTLLRFAEQWQSE